MEDLSHEQEALSWKKKGNSQYKKGNFDAAVKAYEAGADLIAVSSPLRAALLNNLTQCHIQQEDYEAALETAEKSVLYDPTNLKALERRLKCLLKLNKAKQVAPALNRLLKCLSPEEAERLVARFKDELDSVLVALPEIEKSPFAIKLQNDFSQALLEYSRQADKSAWLKSQCPWLKSYEMEFFIKEFESLCDMYPRMLASVDEFDLGQPWSIAILPQKSLLLFRALMQESKVKMAIHLCDPSLCGVEELGRIATAWSFAYVEVKKPNASPVAKIGHVCQLYAYFMPRFIFNKGAFELKEQYIKRGGNLPTSFHENDILRSFEYFLPSVKASYEDLTIQAYKLYTYARSFGDFMMAELLPIPEIYERSSQAPSPFSEDDPKAFLTEPRDMNALTRFFHLRIELTKGSLFSLEERRPHGKSAIDMSILQKQVKDVFSFSSDSLTILEVAAGNGRAGRNLHDALQTIDKKSRVAHTDLVKLGNNVGGVSMVFITDPFQLAAIIRPPASQRDVTSAIDDFGTEADIVLLARPEPDAYLTSRTLDAWTTSIAFEEAAYLRSRHTNEPLPPPTSDRYFIFAGSLTNGEDGEAGSWNYLRTHPFWEVVSCEPHHAGDLGESEVLILKLNWNKEG